MTSDDKKYSTFGATEHSRLSVYHSFDDIELKVLFSDNHRSNIDAD